MKRIVALICALVLGICLFGGCSQETPQGTTQGSTPESIPTVPTITDYSVTVTDGFGVPVTSGVIVQFMQDGQQVAMQPTNNQGVATKNLTPGEYTVQLSFTSDDVSYYYEPATVTADNKAITIKLYQLPSGELEGIYANDRDYEVYTLGAGAFWVTLEQGMNYFLFSPAEAGSYLVFVPEGNAEVGYYGAPHFVQSQSALEVVNNTVSLSVKESMLGGLYVLGLYAESAGNCAFGIQRTGEPEKDISDEPWTIYQPTATLSQYTLPAGSKLADFDLTASSYNLVYNETDGFYHMNSADGPVVVVYLGVASKYMDALNVVAEMSHVCKYFYDADGKFVKKETYNECLSQYFAVMDAASGVYPLTKDLQYIIQQRGDYYGWWDINNTACYLFKDSAGNPIPGINEQIAWLFACGYITQ